MIIAGIDPGVSGGIATYNTKTGEVAAISIPPECAEMFSTFSSLGIDKAYLERLTYAQGGKTIMSEDGMKAIGRQSNPRASGVLGENCGRIQMALTALNVSFVHVYPQTWMGILALGHSTDHKNQSAWKRHLKERAVDLFPSVRPVTLKTSDALLILRYAMLKEGLVHDL